MVIHILNRIWSFFILASLLVAMFSGKLTPAVDAIFSSGEQAVKICLQMLPVICFFCGLLKVAQATGLTALLTKSMLPFFAKLFPGIDKKNPVLTAMSMNLLSNLLGAGNAATAFGISAMKELDSINSNRSRASDAMCMFIILNTCAVSFFPTGILSLRYAAGSKDPAGIILPIVLVSIGVSLFGILLCKLFEKLWHRKQDRHG